MKLTNEERKNLEHCLSHLKANKIDDPEISYIGWYYGKKTDFRKRHKKTLAMLNKWLAGEGEKG